MEVTEIHMNTYHWPQTKSVPNSTSSQLHPNTTQPERKCDQRDIEVERDGDCKKF